MTITRALALALALALTLATGCSSASGSPSGDGPLNGPDYSDAGSGNVCLPAKPGATVTFGGDELHNYGKSKVVVDSIDLAEPHGLRYADAVIVPATTSSIGYATHYPPPKFNLDSVGTGWKRRRPAVGATLAPQSTTSKATHNLVVAIHVTGTSHVRMKGITVDYHVGGKKYRWHNVMGLSVETEKKACR
ncbi:hypothetical protein [Streptomyces sp. MBT53]|uniref:hypothetical protein n=1 Tax=Streptomyces sp. MBT53 TaxID=1488384 RepID=UPI001912EC4F|nr:hypothetical protein [Streptomyces sp. MBT53]MBK6014408.1 hypothetical protein [Streptomyces sp. MBT53]